MGWLLLSLGSCWQKTLLISIIDASEIDLKSLLLIRQLYYPNLLLNPIRYIDYQIKRGQRQDKREAGPIRYMTFQRKQTIH